jgi:hypothetical protein
MKVALKYFWVLALIPILIWLKNDFDLDAEKIGSGIDTIAKTRAIVKDNLTPDPKNVFYIKVNAVGVHSSFDAAGMVVKLYDEDYNLVGNSQVVNGKVRFVLPNLSDTASNFTAVVEATSDDVSFVPNDGKELRIYEAHLAE